MLTLELELSESNFLKGKKLRGLQDELYKVNSSWQEQPLKYKVEKILEDSLDLIPSQLPSVKIQIIGGKVYLR